MCVYVCTYLYVHVYVSTYSELVCGLGEERLSQAMAVLASNDHDHHEVSIVTMYNHLITIDLFI